MVSTSRLLVWMGYTGERLAGSQTQPTHATAQGLLHAAAAAVCRTNSSNVRSALSSRTDAGVHALRNACLMDLPLAVRRGDGGGNCADFDTADAHYVTGALNTVLATARAPVTVLDTHAVSRGFCARRHARHRTYRYRLAVLKAAHDEQCVGASARSFIHPTEHDRCYAVRGGFDRSQFALAAAKLVGSHDVASFMCPLRVANRRLRPNASEKKIIRHLDQLARHRQTVRTIHSIRLLDGRPLIACEGAGALFDHYDVLVTGASFVHQQIRRMVAVLVAVAAHRIPLDCVDELLANPYVNHVCKYLRNGTHLAPATGLYLTDVHYETGDFHNPRPYIVHNWDVPYEERIRMKQAADRDARNSHDEG